MTSEGTDWTRSLIAPLAAAVATLCVATALTGVIQGSAWFGYITVAVVLISCVGLALRALRFPIFVVGIAQLFVLLMLVTAAFTFSGFGGFIPTPTSLNELSQVLGAAGDQIRVGLPPIAGSMPILCLATLAIGLVTIIVDVIAVGVSAPAAAGLVLLCVYAVPASLADELLPWWTFALGAGAFAGLIAVDGNHRHRLWRGKRPSGARSFAPTGPAAVAAFAMVAGLLAGVAFTGIGTVGQFPFSEQTQREFDGGIGLKPFTEMRGLLNDQGDTEVFRVRGLDSDEQLFRAFTLSRYQPREGWELRQPLPQGELARNPRLSRADGDRGGKSTTIDVRPSNWRDAWLPIYGKPRKISGLDSNWNYDLDSGTVFTQPPRKPPPYQLLTSLQEPTRGQLRQVSDPPYIGEEYTELPSVDPRVRNLTERVVRGKSTPFEKATAIWEHFVGARSEFVYDTQTAEATDSDALADFLLRGKRGYCAQFSSAMAVMLRAEGIPARVAIGFTQGTREDEWRSITTRDAHAWVEVYFGESHGWVTFDPTPLTDGRGFVPPYLRSDGDSDEEETSTTPETESSTESAQPTETPPEEAEQEQAEPKRNPLVQAPSWAHWPALLFVVVAGGLTGGSLLIARRSNDRRADGGADVQKLSAARTWLPLASVVGWLVVIALLGWMVSWWVALIALLVSAVAVGPALVRELHRGRRLHDITLSRPTAPAAAWRELLDECADRGTVIAEADTVRQTARDLAAKHDLDADGKRHLGTVVRLLEKSWYSPSEEVDAEFAVAFEHLRRSLRKSAPLTWRNRVLPDSVVSRFRPRR